MHFMIVPDYIKISITIGLAPDLLALLGMPDKIQALTTRLAASQTALQAVVVAHPDPSPTD